MTRKDIGQQICVLVPETQIFAVQTSLPIRFSKKYIFSSTKKKFLIKMGKDVGTAISAFLGPKRAYLMSKRLLMSYLAKYIF